MFFQLLWIMHNLTSANCRQLGVFQFLQILPQCDVRENNCGHTFTAHLVSPELSFRIFLAIPSNTSPKAPFPRNLHKTSWSRRKWGRAAISSSVGIKLKKKKSGISMNTTKLHCIEFYPCIEILKSCFSKNLNRL